MVDNTFAAAVSTFGASAKAKLANPAISGAPEDQLRSPLEKLVRDLAELSPLGFAAVHLVGETTLGHLQTRPDYAVSVNNALAGFIEVKAPGKGFDPRKFADPHDKAQWAKLKSLPNLIYTDGNGFSLWRNGELIGKPVALDGDIETAGAKLSAPDALLACFTDFLTWAPDPPANAKRLAEVSARLCRLLRDEVLEHMEEGHASLLHLRDDWRKLLFPNANNAQFADGYAQAVTFGLLMARAFDVPLREGVELAALKLKKSNTLIGTALNLLTVDANNQAALKTSLGTLLRVLNEVNWHTISKDKPEAWLYFYEDFLEVYDNKLKKLTGSYYTPPEVVSAMVRLVNEALRGPLFERSAGLASADVTIADPAVGTGTFLLGVLRKIAENVEADQGKGAVAPAVAAATKRIFGFEMQFGPFAVAQLRLLAELQALTSPAAGKAAVPDLNLYITDTLGNPFIEEEQLPQIVEAVAKSRREANRVKRGQPITVVIGNPPYKEKAEGRGGWIESGSGGRHQAPLDRWRPPAGWGVGAHVKHLKNLYIYFWRWATLKVFGAGLHEATDLPFNDEEGIVCYITVAGFLNGPGFERMRDDLRRTCSQIWVIDCSPEGHRPEVPMRIFEAVQQPVCIVLAAKKFGKNAEVPATVKFHALPEGKRKEVKFPALAELSLNDKAWVECSKTWRAPFLPEPRGAWRHFPSLRLMFEYNGSGVMPGRTWIIAPDKETLSARWQSLTTQMDAGKREELFHPHEGGDKTSTKPSKVGLRGHEYRSHAVAQDKQDAITPVRYSLRTLDRQWIIPDNRLINRPNPKLWNVHSGDQVYVTAPEDRAITIGPAVSFSGPIPDIHHYHGRGGRVYPLWSDAQAKTPNVRPKFLELLAKAYGQATSPDESIAYIAAVMAHPAFTKRFIKDLARPGLRLPLTADAVLFNEAVKLGREVIWLHCYGERFVDAGVGRPKGPPRLLKGEAPFIPAEGAIPPAPEPLPDTMTYDAVARRLHVGRGYVENVTPEMWNYEISGKQVVWQWFSYRRRDRSKPLIGDRRPPSPLEKIQPDGWLAEYTSDLLDLLNVLGRLIALEPAQADLLERICAGKLIGVSALRAAGLTEAAEAEEAATGD